MKTLFIFALFAVIVATLASAKKQQSIALQSFNKNHEESLPKFHALARNMMRKDNSLVYNLSMKSLPGCIEMTSCKICGYYCGPGWCSDEYITETDCVATGVWGIPAISGGEQCVDNCCRTHDDCCGTGTDRAVCNTNIVSCIDAGDCSGLCSDAVWAALKIVSHFCCGDPCPSYSADAQGNFVPMKLAGASVCDKKSGLKLTFDSETSVKVSHKDGAEICGTHTGVSLNQATNRVSFGTSELDNKKQPLIQLSESCETNGVFAKNALLKGWYFPYTGELLVRDVTKKGEYRNFEKCQ